MKLSEMSGDDLIKLREKCVNKINTNKDKRIEELEELLEAADLRNAEMVVDLEKLEKALREIYKQSNGHMKNKMAVFQNTKFYNELTETTIKSIKEQCESAIPSLKEEIK
tara:strand:+ start:1607 stop:1936 length:330 start_codon:yes stop_codon:yes gene_type:complete